MNTAKMGKETMRARVKMKNSEGVHLLHRFAFRLCPLFYPVDSICVYIEFLEDQLLLCHHMFLWTQFERGLHSHFCFMCSPSGIDKYFQVKPYPLG